MTGCKHEFNDMVYPHNGHNCKDCTICRERFRVSEVRIWQAAMRLADAEIERLTTLLSGMNEAYAELSKKLNAANERK